MDTLSVNSWPHENSFGKQTNVVTQPLSLSRNIPISAPEGLIGSTGQNRTSAGLDHKLILTIIFFYQN